jgi:predicted ferric reductase
MQQHIKPEMKAVVTGPYGRFNYKTGGQKQIWIAGGIGVTPFLSWLRDMDERLDHEIYFFYICKRKDDAIFWSEFEQAAATRPSFHSHLQLSSQDGRITPGQIADMSGGSIVGKDIYLCGPEALTKAFSQQFRDMGIPASQIHYEEFNLR